MRSTNIRLEFHKHLLNSQIDSQLNVAVIWLAWRNGGWS